MNHTGGLYGCKQSICGQGKGKSTIDVVATLEEPVPSQ